MFLCNIEKLRGTKEIDYTKSWVAIILYSPIQQLMRRMWSPLVATIVTISSVKSASVGQVNRLPLSALKLSRGFIVSKLLKAKMNGLMTGFKSIAVNKEKILKITSLKYFIGVLVKLVISVIHWLLFDVYYCTLTMFAFCLFSFHITDENSVTVLFKHLHACSKELLVHYNEQGKPRPVRSCIYCFAHPGHIFNL